MLKACIGLNCARQIDYIDRRHCNLTFIPDDVYRHERTLEELLLDNNALLELPPKFFRLTNLRKLTVSENDINRIPPGIANLTRLVELDMSKNAVEEIPQNMQFCRSLSIFDISSNPLLRTPEAASSMVSLTQLCLNDVAIPRLPTDIGNLKLLIVLEARENALKTLPQSIGEMKFLRRLDVGNNEIELLPREIGELGELTELWLDSNCLTELPETICRLHNLAVLDVTKNRLEGFPRDFAQLTSLSDLHASENCIEALPENVGDLQNLTLVKLDFNHLIEVPESIGRLNKVTELLLFDNMLEKIPPSLFEMTSLELLNLDRNHLMELPSTVGHCRSLHILSLRENEVEELPEEVGQLEELTVLDIVGNRLTFLPGSVSNLKLDALWIDGSQPQPLIALHLESDPENPDKKRLTCAFLPQQGPYSPSLENFLEGSEFSDEPSSLNRNTSLGRKGSFGQGERLGVAFDPSVGPLDSDPVSKIVRFPTPFRKDMKAMKAKRKKGTRFKPNATPSTTIFKKGSSQDDLTMFSTGLEVEKSTESGVGDFKELVDQMNQSPSLLPSSQQNGEMPETQEEPIETGGLTKMSTLENLSGEETPTGVDLRQDTPSSSGLLPDSTPDLLKNAVYATETSAITGTSQLQTIDVLVELRKQTGRSLGFSIAGGRGSTPAYEDVDESIFITKIAPDGLAEQDGRLRLGDKVVVVNGNDMRNATHAEAVAALKSVSDVCKMVVSREVLVVMPEDMPTEEGSQMESPTTLQTPKTRLNFEPGSGEDTGSPSNQPEETEGESFAKKIVSEILGRSVTRFTDSLVAEEGKEHPPAKGEGEEEGEEYKSPHDNYINYDIAQTVLESTARSKSLSPTSAEQEESPLPSQEPREEKKVASPEPEAPTTPATYSIGEQSMGEEGFMQERVILDRSIGLLGLSIVGGVDHTSRIFGQGKPGVYISKITKGGAAHATGRLRLGDRILEVNHCNMREATHQEAVRWLVSQQGNIELLVEHGPQPEGFQEVIIVKDANEKLGISIRGGAKGSKGNPLDPEDEGIFISKITQGGAAERDRRLHVGNRLLEVNGTSLLGVSHLDAVKALRSSSNAISIIVCRGYNPMEVLKKKSEFHRGPRSLDDAVYRLLSESMDALPHRSYSAFSSPMGTLTGLKQSRSFSELGEGPVTAEDLDKVLKGLAKFRDIGTSTKTPPEEPVASTPTPTPSTLMPGTEGLFPLQNGGLGLVLLGEDQPDIPPFVEEPHLDELERPEGPVRSPSLEAEFFRAQTEDTGSLLAALDDEVLHLQDEVSRQEDELLKQEEPEPEPEPEPEAKPQKSPTKVTPVVKVQRPSLTEPSEPSEPPADEEAMKSIIGEVFDEMSFDEFEEESLSSSNASGVLTPATEVLRAMSPDLNPPANFQELLSALQGLGEIKGEKSKGEESKEKEEKAEKKTPSSEEAPTETTSKSVVTTGSPVALRVPGKKRDLEKRKSAPPSSVAPPSVDNPERLTFKEKLALYKKTADNQTSQQQARPQTSKDQERLKLSPPTQHSMKTTASDTAVKSNSVAVESSGKRKDNGSTSISSRIHAFQAKTGVDPVGVHTHVALGEQGRLSAEERRLARAIENSKKRAQSSDQAQPSSDHDSTSTPTKDYSEQSKTTSEHRRESHPAADDPSLMDTFSPEHEENSLGLVESSVDPEPLGGGSNQNNNNSVSKATAISSEGDPVSPYVAQVLANMPPLVQPPEELSDRAGSEEWQRRRAWREEKEIDLGKRMKEMESLLKEAAVKSQSQPGEKKTEHATHKDT